MNKNKIRTANKVRIAVTRLAAIFFMTIINSSAYANTVALEFGPFGSNATGVVDGSAPFGTAVETSTGVLEACSADTDTQLEGADCGNSNGVLRNQDIATHSFSISATGGDPSIPSTENIIGDVVLEITAHPSSAPLAVVTFETIPTLCSELGGGGTNPPSSIVTNADSSVTLTCNVGSFKNGEAKILSIPIQASGLSQNGSSYTTTQRIYSAPNAATTTVNTYEDNTAVTLSGAPGWDIYQAVVGVLPSTTAVFRAFGTGYRDVGFGNELGYYVSSNILTSAARATGIEGISDPLTFSMDFPTTVNSATGASYFPEFYMDSCTPIVNNGFSVLTSGDCTYERADPADNSSMKYNFTITGADLSGNTFPSAYFASDLSSGPYVATAHAIKIWIPMRAIDLADGVEDLSGTIYISSLINDFDPVSVSGLSNYGSNDTEPGYNGQDMDGERSNNLLGSATLIMRALGNFQKYFASSSNEAGRTAPTASSSNTAGDAEMSSDSAATSVITVKNQGTVDLTHPSACDVFDNTTLQLAEQTAAGSWGVAGTYAWVGSYMGTTSDYSVTTSDLIVEYANLDFTGDDPLDKDGDGAYDFDSSTGRFEGSWSLQSTATCNDNDATSGWHTDPSAVTGGLDAVNAVRFRQSDASYNAGLSLTPGQQIRLLTPLRVRSIFNGGPHAGEAMPYGTVMANFMVASTDQLWDSSLLSGYEPSPQNTSSRGDRITLSRASLALDSSSLSPLANSGNTASTLAGNEVVWQVTTSLTSALPGDTDIDNVQIFSMLPPEATYSRACTESQANYTSPSLIQYNTDIDGNTAQGYTRLVWNLGTLIANEPIPERVFCTTTDPLAADGSTVTLESLTTGDDVITTQDDRHDEHSITLLQVGSVKMSKTVDAALDGRNDSQTFTLAWANFSDTVEIEPGVIIDILPYDGDTNVPSSSFSGVYELVGAPTMTFLDGSVPGAGEDSIGTWYYTNDDPTSINPSPLDNTSNWCLESDFGNAGCPTGFDNVSAVKMVSNHKLALNGMPRQGVSVDLTIQAGDPSLSNLSNSNQPSDTYTNKFTFGSTSLPDGQYLTSGSVTVWVASYSVGDLLFADVDGDGLYDPAIDFPVPDGIVVNLYQADGTLIRTTTTGLEKPGRYLFTKLDTGDYYVEIPASEFQNGTVMQQWIPSGLAADPNDNKNEAEDQHAYSPTSPEIDGILSTIITLNASPADPGGGVPTGLEPLSDNTGFLTNDTLDDFSNYGLDLALKPQYYKVSGSVWDDADKDGVWQNNELGIPDTTVVIYGFVFGNQDNMVCESVKTDADGFYEFSMLSGDYQVFEAANEAVPIDSAVCPPEESDPAGYVSTTNNMHSFTIYQADVKRKNFGDYIGIKLSGTVFDDSGNGGGTSGNITQDGDEPSLKGVMITVTDDMGTVYGTATTDTNGYYEVLIPGDATTVVITEQNLSGYFSVGGSAGSATSGTYDLASDSIRFTTDGAKVYTGLDFADIQKPTLLPNNTGSVVPGNFVNYLHRFNTPVAGSVVFSSASGSSTTPGWSTAVYEDANCNGVLDAGEVSVSGQSMLVAAGATICLVNKVTSPTTAISQEQNIATVTANFADATATTSSLLTVTDLTTVTSSDASTLVIRKSVQNITQGTPATETSNSAMPGDELRYRITYLNTGNASITDVVIRDSVPVFTSYNASSANCDSTPTGMTCTPTVTGDDLDWTMTNPLPGLQSGQVSYDVTVDN